jgi:tetratricopeptide (TPR) repeat protein
MLLAALVALLAFAAFVPALDNGFVDWDDPGVLTENEHWRGLGPRQIAWMFTTNHYGHYQPITWLTYGLDYVIWEMDPRGYHLSSALFHAANAVLAMLVAMQLLAAARPEWAREHPWALRLGAALAAAAFAIHPMRVESVAWATERRDLVSAFFLLLTLAAYLRAAAAERGRWWWLGASLCLYVLSMLSKVGGAPIPVVLLVLDWYPLRRLKPGRLRPVLLEKAPFLALALGFSIATILQQTDRWLYPLSDHSLAARTAQSFYGLVFYAWKTALPAGLSPLYELRLPLQPTGWRYVASAAIVIVAAALLLALRRRAPALLAAGLCYAAMLGPLLGFFQNGPQVVADRYAYLSTYGWIVCAAGGLVHLGLARPRLRAWLAGGAAVALAWLGVVTWRQCDVWQSTASLWSEVLRRDPDSSYGNNSYGYVLLDSGQVEASIPHFRRALEINPGTNREAYYNLWRALEESGRTEELARALEEARSARMPEIQAEACYRLGNAALSAGDNATAAERFGQSLSIRGGYAPAHVNRSIALRNLGRLADAEAHARAAVRIDPSLLNARYALVRALTALGRRDDAVAAALEILRIDPQSAWARARLSELGAAPP